MDWKNKLDEFLEKKSKKQKIIVIYWPTASGKTGLSIEIAQYLDSEIISTDSRQIYKQMDIWTGKVTSEEMKNIPHYMLDIIHPDEKYSVGEFKKAAEENIEKIIQKNKVPILCWGTGLYIDSLIYDFDIPKVPADENLRNKLEKEAKEFWNEYVYKQLQNLDPEYAKELHPNNVQYVIRALEVKLLSWKSKKDFRWDKTLKFDVLFLTPYNKDRAFLYNRINARVKMMFDDGLVEEVKNLRKTYQDSTAGLSTIWYIEVVKYLLWEYDLDECISLVQQHNRNYAKRQLTWFRKYEETTWDKN